MSSGNGHAHVPAEVVEFQYPPIAEEVLRKPRHRPLWTPLILFLLTIISTLAVGAEFSISYSQNREPFSSDENPFTTMARPFEHPELLALGIPFSFTLLGILLAHELGHYFTCRKYGIDVTYPYFIPAPTILGTFGAFIRIRSPIPTRRALFDVGLSGPVVGFIFAVPALIFAIANSKIVPGLAASSPQRAALRKSAAGLLAHFDAASAHAARRSPSASGRPRRVGRPVRHSSEFAPSLATRRRPHPLLPNQPPPPPHLASGRRNHPGDGLTRHWKNLFWDGWVMWGGLLLAFSWFFRHPPLLNRWEPLDPKRRMWAVYALIIFVLCFTPWPTTNP